MRIAVVGVGAVGGFFGARLAAAGEDVVFVARGAHGRALRTGGLRLRSPLGDLHLQPLRVLVPGERSDRPVGLVLVAVKMYDLSAAAPAVAALVGPETLVLPIENGVEAGDILAPVVAPAEVAPAVAYIGGHIEEPGVIRHVGTTARLVFGSPDGRPDPRLEAFAGACRRAGIDHVVSPAMAVELWRKFVFLAPFAAMTALARVPAGGLREDPGLWARTRALVEEAAAVGRARAVPLPDGIVDDRLALIRGLPAGMRSSMLTDLLAGRPLELEWLLGAVVRLGEASGVPVPESRAVLEALRATLAAGSPAQPEGGERTSR
jgi:2-dehydropantoate 2-reductase